MTEKQKNFAKRLKKYFERKNDIEYSSVMTKAQHDNNFEKMIQSMTVGRIAGRNSLEKYHVKFDYKPKGE